MEKYAILLSILGTLNFIVIILFIKPIVRKYKPQVNKSLQEQTIPTKEERQLLEIEYREACQDWRQRDKYVLDKLGISGLLFGIIGISFGTIGDGQEIIKLCLLFVGTFFSFMLAVSVAKDTYYRDGTEYLVKALATRLGIPEYLRNLKSLERLLYADKKSKETLDFPRKVRIKRDLSSVKIGFRLRDGLLDRQTFSWILAFYLGSCLIFINLIVIILVKWILKMDLPV
ncbi:MAG: hypothetical protein A2158_05135 [Chloroflexi bacterium RBG_13_46_14]|nr:MAG: hypothetical protein A2158_05135 [Chloroflexi bacterium RBG_13_46_14]